ncbi:MAG: DUF4364 family protein [Clostridia bacterium]|nr:DUF4364 family protein [Clostridia bacterium]
MQGKPYRYPVIKNSEIKLLILYIAEQARSVCKKDSIDRIWLSDFVMLNIKTEYFKFQCVLGDLITDGYLIAEEKDGKQLLTITYKGTETIGFFFTDLPQSVRVTVDKNLIASLKAQKTKDSVHAEYVHINNEVHMGSLRLYDNDTPLLHLDITMPDHDTAVALSKAMRNNPSIFYKRLIETCNEAIEIEKQKEEKE